MHAVHNMTGLRIIDLDSPRKNGVEGQNWKHHENPDVSLNPPADPSDRFLHCNKPEIQEVVIRQLTGSSANTIKPQTHKVGISCRAPVHCMCCKKKAQP